MQREFYYTKNNFNYILIVCLFIFHFGLTLRLSACDIPNSVCINKTIVLIALLYLTLILIYLFLILLEFYRHNLRLLFNMYHVKK